MADVQLENGYTKIANELLEALYSTDFSEYEHRIIKFVIRLSYGCNKKTALIRHWNDLCVAGIPASKIKSTINRLKENKIITIDNDILEISLNKDYDTWGIKRCSGYDVEKWIDILRYNLKMSGQTKSQTELTKSQTELTKSTTNYNNSQYEKYTEVDEKSIPKLTKSQIEVDEKLTETAVNSNNSIELQPPKDSIKDNYIANENVDIHTKITNLIKRYCPTVLSNLMASKKDQIVQLQDFEFEHIEPVMKRANREGKGPGQFLGYVLTGLDHYDEWYADNSQLAYKQPERYKGLHDREAWFYDMLGDASNLCKAEGIQNQYYQNNDLIKVLLSIDDNVVPREILVEAAADALRNAPYLEARPEHIIKYLEGKGYENKARD